MAERTPSARSRDAERSREAILAAAERSFAASGYDAVSLVEIAEAAQLSRATPSYFFGSKAALYAVVLERVFERRQQATVAAFAPVHRWCADGGDDAALRDAVRAAAVDYMQFLADDPGFARLVQREELAGGATITGASGASTAMTDAFSRVRSCAPERGLPSFDVGDVVFLFVALTFTPFSQASTLMRALDRDATRDGDRLRHADLAVEAVMHLLAQR